MPVKEKKSVPNNGVDIARCNLFQKQNGTRDRSKIVRLLRKLLRKTRFLYFTVIRSNSIRRYRSRYCFIFAP